MPINGATGVASANLYGMTRGADLAQRLSPSFLKAEEIARNLTILETLQKNG